MRKIALHIGSHAFTATLDDTPAAAAFAQLLPLNSHSADWLAQ